MSGVGPPGGACRPTAELLPAYVLGGLDQEEAALVARHLEGCSSCSLEADHLAVTAASIGESVAPVAPPPGLRMRLLEQARRTEVREASPPRGQVTAPWWHRARSGWMAAGVAAAVALAAIGWGVAEHQALPSPPPLAASLQPVSSASLSRLIANGEASVVDLKPAGGDSASAELVTNLQDGTTYLRLSGVKAARAPTDYTLWYMSQRRGSLIPLDVGGISSAGSFRLPRSPFGYSEVAVTHEPQPHDRLPQGPVLLSASLQ